MQKTLALPLHFLDENKTIDFDIYVWAGGKPVLYCRADDIKLSERISKLKSKKGLDHFLVIEKHYSAFIGHMSAGLESVYQTDPARKLKQQVEDIYYQQRGLLIVLSAEPSSKEYYSILRSTCSSFYNFFCSNEDALRYFYQLNFENNEFDLWLNHSLRVAALSARLISESETDEAGKPIFDIIMGAFLHDMGYLALPWNQQEVQSTKDPIYKGHPLEGVKLLDHAHVNPWVRSVILKHEEHIDGSGFPAAIREDDLDPIIQCVAVANAFDRLFTLQKKSFEEALKKILIDKMGAYPLPLLQKLQGIIKGLS
jgi:HD superfamily phosphodiesterase